MKKILTTVIIALLCSSMFTILVRAQPTPVVYVDPPTFTAQVGETFDVNIMVSNVENLWAWQAGVQWDENILQVVSFTWGDFREALAGAYTVRLDPVIGGMAGKTSRPALETAIGFSATPVSSTAPVKLLTITFQAIGLGSGTVSLTDVALRGQDPTATTSYPRWSDVNGDGKVDVKDVAPTVREWYHGYNEAVDFNDDDYVDITDIAIVTSDFAKNLWGPNWGVTKTIYPITPTLGSCSVTTTPDTTPPTTTVSLSGTQGVPPWFTGPVTVTLEATDNGGTVAETDYSFDGLAWTTYICSFDITTEGATTVYYNSTDNVGNMELTKSEIIKVDTSAPVITITSPTAQDYPQSETLAISYGATDAISELASVTATLGYDPAGIYVDPSTSTGMVGQTFTVNVTVDQVADLYAWQIKMYFEPTTLECTNVTYPQDHIFADRPFIPVVPIIDNDAGWLMSAAQLVGMDSFTGSGKLVQIEFRVKIEGSSDLAFDTIDTLLLDSNLNEISYTAYEGSFTSLPFLVEHDVAITNVVASPNVVTAGELVAILVDVQNQGTVAETVDVTAYYDSNVILPQTVVVPPFGALETLTFSWDTTSVPMGLYEIKAEANPVPGETDLSDNALVNGAVLVRVPVTSGQEIDLSTLELGKYTLTVTAVDNAGNVAVDSITFNVINTPTGTSVAVSVPAADLTLTFDSVTIGGITEAATTDTGPEAPTGFLLGAPNTEPIYYEITTTATYAGPIQISITYDPSRFTNEVDLRLMQWDTQLIPPAWADATISVDAVNNIIYGQVFHLSIFAVMEPIPHANIDVDPDTLNLKSKGNWITCFIWLPEGYNVTQIDPSTIMLNDTVPAQAQPVSTGDSHMMVKFDRAMIQELILSQGIKRGSVNLTVVLQLYDGPMFEGSDNIRVLMPGDVNGDCKVNLLDISMASKAWGSLLGQPNWNPLADQNEDDKIDSKDIAQIAANCGKKYI